MGWWKKGLPPVSKFKITREQVEYVQKMHEDNAKLNNEECDTTVFVQDGFMYSSGPHKITGKTVRTLVPPSVYMHVGA